MIPWEDVKARKREADIRWLALELDPVIYSLSTGGPALTDGYHLSEIVADDGWTEAEAEYPEVRRFLDRLGAVVDKRDYTQGFRDGRRAAEDRAEDMANRYRAALESGEAVLAQANSEIERLKGVAHGFVDEITELSVDNADIRADLATERHTATVNARERSALQARIDKARDLLIKMSALDVRFDKRDEVLAALADEGA